MRQYPERALLLLAWLALMLTGVLYLRHTPVTHDLMQFIPVGATPQQQLAVTLLREGPASRLILIALENAPGMDLAVCSNRLARKLRASNRFTLISNGSAESNRQLALPYRYRYLLDPHSKTAAFSGQALHQALQQRLAELAAAVPLTDREHLETDPTAAFRSVLDTWRPQRQPHLHYGVWFSADDRQALLIAVTRARGFDPQAQHQAIRAIHAAFDSVKPAAGTRLLLSGAPVFSSNARDTIRSGLQRFSLAAGLLVMAFLLYAYRSFRLVLLGGIPLLSGLLAGALVTVWLFNAIHGITLVFGITLLGVAIDYPIHLFSHLDTDRSARQSMRYIWPTLRLGVVTTCIGYLAFARRDFSGLAQLGTFATSGLLTAAAVTRWLLPVLIDTGRLPKIPQPLAGMVRKLLLLPGRSARLLLGAAGILLTLLLLLRPPEWETDLSALSPLTAAERQLDGRLRTELGAPDVSKLIVVRGSDLEATLQDTERIATRLQRAVDRGLLSGFDAATRYLPSRATQLARQQSLPDASSAAQQLAAAMQELPFRQDAFEPFLEALTDSRSLPPLTLREVSGTPIGVRTESLLFNDSQGWKSLLLLSGMDASAEFLEWWDQQPMVNARFLDLKQVSDDMLAKFRDSALERLAFGILAILLILAVGLRSARRAFLTLLPVLVATGLTAALLGGIGERLSLFHLIAMLLTAGIGIDYSLFFRRKESGSRERLATLHALLVCAVSTVAVFGILATSPIPVLRAIGFTVTIGVPLCFLLSLVSARLGDPGSGGHKT